MDYAEAPTPVDIERRVIDTLRRRLPAGWEVQETVLNEAWPDGADIAINLGKKGVGGATLIVEVSQNIDRRDVLRKAERLRGYDLPVTPVIASRFLSKSVRDALIEEGLSYIDATGNMRIEIDAPAIFISDRGEDRDPWSRGRPKGNLKGEPAARVVRALLDYRRSWRVRELLAVSGASTGTTYRVLDYLQREDLLDKRGDLYDLRDWVRLLRMWSEDSSFQTTSSLMTFIEPRGVEAVLERIVEEQDLGVAVTGSVAAREWATYAPAKAAYVYVSSIQAAAEKWELRPNTTAPNVILLEPKQKRAVPFVNTLRSREGYRIAAPAQVAADLLNGPGREPSEGEFLIDWMKENESEWRRER